MKWQGRRGSSNVEDRRGMSSGKRFAGGGIGSIVIVLIVWLLGGDPLSILDQAGGGTTEEYNPLPKKIRWHSLSPSCWQIQRRYGERFSSNRESTYRQPKLVLFRDQVQCACGYATAASGPFYCPV